MAMIKNSNYYSVSRAQWQHIGFDIAHKIKAQQANQNSKDTQQNADKNRIKESQSDPKN
jgi:hypothetical protein